MIKIVLSLACILAASLGEAAEQGPVGEWLVKDKTAHMRILACNKKLWGIISWAKTPGKDSHNPDPAKRSRSVLGMPILLGMEKKDEEWDGTIYNADNGKLYKGSIRLKSENTLHVEGCVLGLLCGGEDWTRVESAPNQEAPETICGRLDPQ